MPSNAEERSFYEAKWAKSDFSAGSLRNYLVRKERFFVRHLSGKRGRVLDLGCGGGWALYTRVGPVVGADLSHSSLLRASRVYQGAVLADLSALPFESASFDFVVSSDVLGHVDHWDKDVVLNEIWRVLKPAGRTIHYVEADGDDPLMRFAKRYPDLYHRYMIKLEGHIGLETASDIAARFRRLGFRPIAEVPAYRGLTYVGRLVQYFDNEYASKSRAIRLVASLAKLLTRSRVLELASNLMLSVMIEIGDRVLPERWAGGMLVCYEKGD
jgi:SAM-dependent methyltransferase